MGKKLTILTAALACLSLASVAYGQTITCFDIQGAAGCAPSPLDGTTQTMTGVVYVQPGTYNSGSLYMQCDAGGGITAFDSGLNGFIFEGDHVEITGVIGAFGDEIQFSGGFSINVLGAGSATASGIGTQDLTDGTERMGDFLSVEGVLTLISSGFNSTYEVDDGSGPVIIFVDGTTGIDTAAMDAMLGDVVNICGASKCFGGVGEILPRKDSDIRLVTVGTGVKSMGAVKAQY